jgi:hypothetical protein
MRMSSEQERKQYNQNNMKKNNVTKWEKTGLLKFLNQNQKVDCANLLEKLSNVLIKTYKNKTTTKSAMICGTILPIVRRLMDKNIKTLPTATWLYKDYTKFLKGHPELNPLKQDLENSSVDYELKLCNEYTENVSSRLKNKYE